MIQRAIELLQAIPRIPLWLTLSAALPRDWGTVVYFGITIILSVLGWTGLARTVRGKFLALREEDFTQAAKYLGASEMRTIIRHLVPSFSSHLMAVLTLRVPEMILAETSLSFLGLGLCQPVMGRGVLLTGVQNIRAVAPLAVPARGGDRGSGAGVQLRRRWPPSASRSYSRFVRGPGRGHPGHGQRLSGRRVMHSMEFEMTKATMTVLADALRLDLQGRSELVWELLASLDGAADPEAALAWAAEIKRRVEALESGSTELESWDDTKRRIVLR